MITVSRITTTEQRRLAKAFVNAFHSYIQWADRPSRKLYWEIRENGRIIGIWGLGSCFSHPLAVKQCMTSNGLEFNNIGNNIVFALHNHSKNAGSRALAILRRDAILWWKERYGDDLLAFQTFILPPRTGAIYRADNWKQIGMTRGGKTQRTRTIKPSQLSRYPKAKKKTYRSGEVKWTITVYEQASPKIILMLLVRRK